MTVAAKPIMIRWPNEECGGYFKIHGFLVNPNVALAVFDGNLVVHVVEPSLDQNEHELRYASNPMSHEQMPIDPGLDGQCGKLGA